MVYVLLPMETPLLRLPPLRLVMYQYKTKNRTHHSNIHKQYHKRMEKFVTFASHTIASLYIWVLGLINPNLRQRRWVFDVLDSLTWIGETQSYRKRHCTSIIRRRILLLLLVIYVSPTTYQYTVFWEGIKCDSSSLSFFLRWDLLFYYWGESYWVRHYSCLISFLCVDTNLKPVLWMIMSCDTLALLFTYLGWEFLEQDHHLCHSMDQLILRYTF